MRVDVIACNICHTYLGEPGREFDAPQLDSEAVDTMYENGEYIIELSNGWRFYALPDPEDPVAISLRHRCPDHVDSDTEPDRYVDIDDSDL